MDFEKYQELGLHLTPPAEMNGFSHKNRKPEDWVIKGDIHYHPCKEAFPAEGVASGTFSRIAEWSESSIYPGTTRAISIYQSSSVKESDSEPLFAFFNDGDGYLWRQGDVRATHVFDTLTSNGELAPIVAVFVNPGQLDGVEDQRSIEYDTVSSRFVEFINQDVVPLVETAIGRELSKNPAHRLIGGISSGGICAFNAAWHSPESFGRVLSHCGSFVNIRGGHNYPSLIRRTPRKPVRVFLQSGEDDLNIIPGCWSVANQDMAASLKFAGYDYRFEYGVGGHSLCHGGSLFAESIRWLFRD